MTVLFENQIPELMAAPITIGLIHAAGGEPRTEATDRKLLKQDARDIEAAMGYYLSELVIEDILDKIEEAVAEGNSRAVQLKPAALVNCPGLRGMHLSARELRALSVALATRLRDLGLRVDREEDRPLYTVCW